MPAAPRPLPDCGPGRITSLRSPPTVFGIGRNADVLALRGLAAKQSKITTVSNEVVHGGDARQQAFGNAEPHADIGVLRRAKTADAQAGREVTLLGIVGTDDQPQRGAPQMPMRVDEARHYDHVAAVDHLRIGSIDVGADGDDCAVADMHIAAGQVAEVCVHRQDVAAAHNEFAARRQRATGYGRRDLRLCGLQAGQRKRGGEAPRKPEHVAAMKPAAAEHADAPRCL